MSPKADDNRIVVGGVPRADLLPPEIKEEKGLRRQRRSLVAVLVLSLALVVIAYGGATFLAAASAVALETANQRTADLLAEKAKYSAVSDISNQITNVENAQLIGTSTEVDWTSYLFLLNSTLPAGVGIANVGITAATPLAPLPATGSLQLSSVGKLEILAKTGDFGSVATWLESLKSLKGYAGAVLSSIASTDGGVLDVKVTLYVNTDVLLNRFLNDDTDTTTEDPDSADPGTSTPTPGATETDLPVDGTTTDGDEN